MDSKTMFLVVSIGYAVFGLMLALFEGQRERSERLRYFIPAFLLISAGVLLQYLRDVTPLVVSVLLGNLVTLLGLVFQYWGIRSIADLPDSKRLRYSTYAAITASAILAAALAPMPRLILASAIYATLFALPAWALVRWSEGGAWLRASLAIVFAAVALMYVVRAAASLVAGVPAGAFGTGEANKAAYLAIYLAMLVTGFGVLLLSKDRADQRLRRTNQELSTTLATLPNGLLIVRDRTIVRANPAAESILGYPTGGLVGIGTDQFRPVDSQQDSPVYPALHSTGEAQTEMLLRRRDGRTFWAWVSAKRLGVAGDAPDAVISITDISDIKALQDELHELAHVDELTRLPNRRAFFAQGSTAVDTATVSGRPFSVALVDVDRLKEINDRLGHAAGDRTLRQVAKACRSAVGDSGIAARLGGDEFALLLPGSDTADGESIVTAIQEALAAEPLRIDDIVTPLSTSIGMASWAPGDSFAETLAKADQSMYRAKQANRDSMPSRRTGTQPG